MAVTVQWQQALDGTLQVTIQVTGKTADERAQEWLEAQEQMRRLPVPVADVAATTADTVFDNAWARTQLTPREFEAYLLWRKGKQYKEIAKTLHITINTVSSHVREIRAKLGLRNWREAARRPSIPI